MRSDHTKADPVFSIRLRQTREKKGITQTELAERMKVNKSYICNLEAGRKLSPQLSTIRRLAKALGVTAESLISR